MTRDCELRMSKPWAIEERGTCSKRITVALVFNLRKFVSEKSAISNWFSFNSFKYFGEGGVICRIISAF